ncbi:hypothetical protein FA15DRAFT_675729 [Coprinopsis marcescibilis]|uniref:Uncharacterized protein n=1 Tax=Coprinopsis marcescibilis TaxID=230819 RepID=A0A5C3KCR3_COPMA|nr:hypothetical protein FA15DRAFT_675729 [Coprinopsis marcescibilis]
MPEPLSPNMVSLLAGGTGQTFDRSQLVSVGRNHVTINLSLGKTMLPTSPTQQQSFLSHADVDMLTDSPPHRVKSFLRRLRNRLRRLGQSKPPLVTAENSTVLTPDTNNRVEPQSLGAGVPPETLSGTRNGTIYGSNGTSLTSLESLDSWQTHSSTSNLYDSDV